jgi:hypothetical protein
MVLAHGTLFSCRPMCLQVDPADIPTMDDFVRQHADLRKISKIG